MALNEWEIFLFFSFFGEISVTGKVCSKWRRAMSGNSREREREKI